MMAFSRNCCVVIVSLLHNFSLVFNMFKGYSLLKIQCKMCKIRSFRRENDENHLLRLTKTKIASLSLSKSLRSQVRASEAC